MVAHYFFRLIFHFLTFASLSLQIIPINLFQMQTTSNYKFGHLSTRKSAMPAPNHTCHTKNTLRSSRACNYREDKSRCASKARIRSFAFLPKIQMKITVYFLCVDCTVYSFISLNITTFPSGASCSFSSFAILLIISFCSPGVVPPELVAFTTAEGVDYAAQVGCNMKYQASLCVIFIARSVKNA